MIISNILHPTEKKNNDYFFLRRVKKLSLDMREDLTLSSLVDLLCPVDFMGDWTLSCLVDFVCWPSVRRDGSELGQDW